MPTWGWVLIGVGSAVVLTVVIGTVLWGYAMWQMGRMH